MMGKKVKGKLDDQQMAEKVTDSAQDIWLAGLAAFEQAQGQGGKFFDALVKEGQKIETRMKELIGSRFDEVVEEVKSRATRTWDKLEQVFEERVAQTLSQLGIPSSEDLQDLKGRIEKLEKRIKELHSTRSSVSGPGQPAVKDNLKRITGLGRAIEKQLNDYGITRFKQLAQLSEQDVAAIEAAGIKITERMQRENWVGQAKEQHWKKYNEKL